MKYLILGNKGQLGKEFEKYFIQNDIEYSGYDIDKINIANSDDIIQLVDYEKPSVIINCAAYNNVDAAENDKSTAIAVNKNGVENLAHAALKHSAFLVHYSSDYVFDGNKDTGLYIETDRTNPLSVYGESKLAGEKIALGLDNDSLVFRLSWVFGKGTQNFIYKLRQWAKSNDRLKIVYDEFSVPTYTKTVVELTMASLGKGLSGLFHLTNSGYCSRYEWAKLILNTLKKDIFIYPCPMSDFDLPARRPKFSSMDNSKISNELGIDIVRWETAVKDFIMEL